MVKPHVPYRRTGNRLRLICLLLVLFFPLASAAASELISDSALDDSDPVELSSHIMSIDYGKGMLVVAELEVIIVDMLIADDQFTTRLINGEGEAISIEALYEGQKVLVQGLKLNDGRVVAATVQLLDESGLSLRIKAVREIEPVE